MVRAEVVRSEVVRPEVARPEVIRPGVVLPRSSPPSHMQNASGERHAVVGHFSAFNNVGAEYMSRVRL